MPKTRALLATLLIGCLATGCFSVRSTSIPAPPGTEQLEDLGGVAFRIYADDGARRQGEVADGAQLVTVLERRTGEIWESVFRSLDPSWSVMGLEPGRYRISFPARLDDSGNPIASTERPKSIRVRAGQVTAVEATLEHVSKPLVAAGVVTAVAAAILLHDWLGDHDLPTPPLPPPPPELLEAVFWIGIDIATAPDWEVAGPERAPVVTSHFPEDGALVATRNVRVVFALSRPLEPGSELRSAGVTVAGEVSGPLSGSLEYDAQRVWLVWESDDDLPRGEAFHVTLEADAVSPPLGEATSFGFRTTS